MASAAFPGEKTIEDFFPPELVVEFMKIYFRVAGQDNFKARTTGTIEKCEDPLFMESVRRNTASPWAKGLVALADHREAMLQVSTLRMSQAIEDAMKRVRLMDEKGFLGRGSYASVQKVDLEGTPLALRISGIGPRGYRNAAMMALLNFRGEKSVPRLYAFGEYNGKHYTFMELVNGSLCDLFQTADFRLENRKDPKDKRDEEHRQKRRHLVFHAMVELYRLHKRYGFKHNDSHDDNVLWTRDTRPASTQSVGNERFDVPTYGIRPLLTDFEQSTIDEEAANDRDKEENRIMYDMEQLVLHMDDDELVLAFRDKPYSRFPAIVKSIYAKYVR